MKRKFKKWALKLYGIYLAKTNTTQRDALAILNRIVETDVYKCPDCGIIFHNDLRFQEHLADIHGYPSDFDISRYTTTYIRQNKKMIAKEIKHKQDERIIKTDMNQYLKHL